MVVDSIYRKKFAPSSNEWLWWIRDSSTKIHTWIVSWWIFQRTSWSNRMQFVTLDSWKFCSIYLLHHFRISSVPCWVSKLIMYTNRQNRRQRIESINTCKMWNYFSCFGHFGLHWGSAQTSITFIFYRPVKYRQKKGKIYIYRLPIHSF